MNRSKLLLFLIIVLALGGCYECAKLYIGDGCKSGDISGRCTLGSECKTHAAFIQHRLLTKEQIKSCALGVYEEIICCPLDNEVNKKLLMESPTYYEDVSNTQQSGFGSGTVGSGGFRNTENGGTPLNINEQLALQNSGATADCAETTQRMGLNTGFGQDSSAFGNGKNNNQDFFDEPSAFPSPQQQQHSNNNAGNTDQIFNGQSAFGESAFPKTPEAPKRRLCDPHHKDCIVYRDDDYIKFKVGDWCSFKSYVGTCAARSNCTTLKRLFDAHLVVNEDVSTCGFNAYEEIICCPSY